MTTERFSPDSGPRCKRRSKLSAAGRATQSSYPATDCYSSPDGWRCRAAIMKAFHDFPEARESAVTALRTLNALKDSQAPDFEKRFEEYDEDKRGGAAFSALADKSK